MKIIGRISLFLLVGLISCQSTTDQTASNNSKPSMDSDYTEDAIRIDASGAVLQGRSALAEAEPLLADTLSPIFTVVANEEGTYDYEIGTFEELNGTQYHYLGIWKRSPEGRQRAFEFVSPSRAADTSLTEIHQRREAWMELCNNHDVSNLVEQLYTESAIYYNHKPLVIGRDDIIKEYQYMSREEYQLSLEPIHIEVVSDDMIFEIGQCAGSYNGKYLFVWKKDEDGVWRVFMDSNI